MYRTVGMFFLIGIRINLKEVSGSADYLLYIIPDPERPQGGEAEAEGEEGAGQQARGRPD
jgi:hypothetical protein